jgi:hypothetical protein
MLEHLLLACLLPSSLEIRRETRLKVQRHTFAIATPARYGSFEKPSQFRPPCNFQLPALSIEYVTIPERLCPRVQQLVRVAHEHPMLLIPCLFVTIIVRTGAPFTMCRYTKSISPRIHQRRIPRRTCRDTSREGRNARGISHAAHI